MLARACQRCTATSVAEYTGFYCAGLVISHLRYISREPDGSSLSKYCSGDRVDVHIGIELSSCFIICCRLVS